jgi:hypothetical protein
MSRGFASVLREKVERSDEEEEEEIEECGSLVLRCLVD